MRRRDFIRALSAAGCVSLAGCRDSTQALPPGESLGASMNIGHRLQAGDMPSPTETEHVRVVIVGAGVAGLSAGWKLAKAGFNDFVIAELEAQPGGNSRAGQGAAGPFPLAAHYLPIPTQEAVAVRELLSELGVLIGDPRAEQPRYDERFLCAVPQERLYRHGRWEDGLVPAVGIGADERAQYKRFFTLMESFKRRCDQGRRAFALPMALSSRADDLVALDRQNLRDWLLAQGFDSSHLHWYVDYACRDDFGTRADAVSAWAGVHYFACRNGQARDASGDAVLTSPGGNAWLADGMVRSIRERAGDRIRTGALAFRVIETGDRMAVDVWSPTEQRVTRIEAEQLIWAAPLFLVPHVFAGNASLKAAAAAFSYAPWLVANLTLARFPAERSGAGVAWDNVLFDSPGLGYVVSTHQQMRVRAGATVFTYYRALAEVDPAAGRALLLGTPHETWVEQVLAELEGPHPDIRQVAVRVDTFRLGHAMVRPTPGLIWGTERARFAGDFPRVRFAHADVSGFSLFEEAQYRGILAAERTLRRLGRDFVSSLA